CLLLLLQIDLRFGRGVPSVAAVLRPISTLPVIAVDVSVLSRIDVVRARSNPGTSVCGVGKSTAAGRPLPGVHVARVPGAATSYDPCIRVIAHSTTPCDAVAGVDVGIGAPACNAYGATLRVLEGGWACSTIVPSLGIRPGGAGTRVSGIAPASVYVRTRVAAVAVSPGWPPAASSVVAPWPPPRVIVGITGGVADTDRDAPTSPRTPRRGNSDPVGVGRSIPVMTDIGRIVPTCAVDDRSGCRRDDRAVITGGVAYVNDVRRGAVHLDVCDVVQRGTRRY